MKFATVEFTSGHRLTDNGVGDYNLQCPSEGDIGFMDPGMVLRITTEDMRCSGCGNLIGAPSAHTSKPYDRA